MAIWLDDLLEQVATATVLADSKTETGKRLAFIIVDNAVEFLMKGYVESESQLVGFGRPITRADWENKKKYFEQVLDVVFGNFTVTASRTDILSYHDVRNKLYHEGKPLSVSPNTISKYINQLLTLLNDLHHYRLTDDQWRKKAYDVSQMIAQKEAQTKTVITYSNVNGQTRFKTDVTMMDTEAIMHAIHAYSHYFGSGPSLDEIELILNRSSQAIEKSVINKRLDHLKSKKMLLKSKLLLDPKAVEKLRKKYAINTDAL